VDVKLPIAILGGSDLRPARLPSGGRHEHPLSAYKGVDVRISGRPLIAVLVERLVASGVVEPIWIAGPARIYADLGLKAEIIDTDGSFAENVRAAIERARTRLPGHPLAFTTCDIVPEPGDVRAALAAWKRSEPCDIWQALIRVPKDRSRLGTSAWKPTYRVVPRPGAAPVDILPGHLVIADTDAIRLAFVYGLLGMGYRMRNRSIVTRLILMPLRVVGSLVWQDLLHIAGGRAPTLTWEVMGAGLSTALRLRAGKATLIDIGDAVRRIFVKRRHRLRHPDRGIVLEILDSLSLALDIDTEEEAHAMGATLPGDRMTRA